MSKWIQSLPWVWWSIYINKTHMNETAVAWPIRFEVIQLDEGNLLRIIWARTNLTLNQSSLDWSPSLLTDWLTGIKGQMVVIVLSIAASNDKSPGWLVFQKFSHCRNED